MSLLIRQKLVENVKIEKLKCVILGDFQTLCVGSSSKLLKVHKFWIVNSENPKLCSLKYFCLPVQQQVPVFPSPLNAWYAT